ncbi:hypothetical protein ALC53_03554 [Atta colombica]|uniref:Uncharacterized protein n=1 Tax=Atta colombica TaxID=520822 RepID=A0A195BPI8_9HYME|nr:hypothetical protein ALC53_03554 [Atta colombica]
MGRCANAVVQAPLVLVDARVDPSDRWVQGRRYRARLGAAYRPAPSCRPDPSDGAPLDDAANRPCEAPDDGDGARARRPPYAGEACEANRSSFRGAASDGDSAKRRAALTPPCGVGGPPCVGVVAGCGGGRLGGPAGPVPASGGNGPFAILFSCVSDAAADAIACRGFVAPLAVLMPKALLPR